MYTFNSFKLDSSHGHEGFSSIPHNDIRYIEADNAMCSHMLTVAYTNHSSLLGLGVANREILRSSINDHLNAKKMSAEEALEKFSNDISILSKEDISILDNNSIINWTISSNPYKMEKIIIPKGKDLSNSFKAKYIWWLVVGGIRYWLMPPILIKDLIKDGGIYMKNTDKLKDKSNIDRIIDIDNDDVYTNFAGKGKVISETLTPNVTKAERLRHQKYW